MIPLTPLQKQTSTAITQLTQLPTVLSDMITHYAEDFSMAQRLGVPTKNKKIIDIKLREAISDALISASCDPLIKREIIDNAIFGHYKEALNGILDEIRQRGYVPNLDYTDLSGLDLSGLNLTGISANSAKFVKSSLRNVNLTDADLTGAWIQSSSLVSATLARTVLYKAFVRDADLTGACLTGTDLHKAQLQRVKTGATICVDVMTDNAELQKILDEHAIPDGQGKISSIPDICLFDTGRVQKKPLTRRVITLPSRVAELTPDPDLF